MATTRVPRLDKEQALAHWAALPGEGSVMSRRDACPGCNRTFLSGGTGLAWHLAHEPKCSRAYDLEQSWSMEQLEAMGEIRAPKMRRRAVYADKGYGEARREAMAAIRPGRMGR